MKRDPLAARQEATHARPRYVGAPEAAGALRAAYLAAPLSIGPKNAEALTGLSWRWLRDNAEDLGVEVVRVGGKSFIPAGSLREALERRALSTEGSAAEPDEEELTVEDIARRLGKRRRR